MRVLALDVAVSGCRVAILDTDKDMFFQSEMDTDRGQAEHLVPMIAEIITKANVTMGDIDCIAVTVGPGSFTGVRIGLATARHLGLALNKPVCGIPTFDALRATYTDRQTLLLIDTKRGDFYGQVGNDAPRIWSTAETETYTGAMLKDALPDMRAIAELASRMQMTECYDAASAPEPIYLRGAEVSQPKRPPPICIDSSGL